MAHREAPGQAAGGVRSHARLRAWALRRSGGGHREVILAGRDFESFEYPEGCVVADNPPFFIFARIQDFYLERSIGLLKRKRVAEHMRPTTRD